MLPLMIIMAILVTIQLRNDHLDRLASRAVDELMADPEFVAYLDKAIDELSQ